MISERAGGLFRLKLLLQGLKVEYRKFSIISIQDLVLNHATSRREVEPFDDNEPIFREAYRHLHETEKFPIDGVSYATGNNFEEFSVNMQVVKYTPTIQSHASLVTVS
jgi:hypothetical protein